MTFGHFIYAFRKALDLTQEAFSEQLDVQEGYTRFVYPRYVQRWEHDKNMPRQATVTRMRLLDAPLFDRLWLSALRQHEFQQCVSEITRSRRSRPAYRFGR